MIALIAEKPSVAKDIARIIGATQRNDGYLSGNGYMVTWAFGDRKSTRLNSSHWNKSRMPSSA